LFSFGRLISVALWFLRIFIALSLFSSLLGLSIPYSFDFQRFRFDEVTVVQNDPRQRRSAESLSQTYFRARDTNSIAAPTNPHGSSEHDWGSRRRKEG
jgi:hypothetical protein